MMSLLNIDRKKCKRDGLCALECPSRIIVQTDRKSFPSLIENGEEFCTNCGHCVAVCPYGALTLETMPLAACPPVQTKHLPDADAVGQLLKARRSIRQYKKKVVSQKLLKELIDTARYAPTGSNSQQVHWTVVQNPEDVHTLAGMVIDFMKMMHPLMTDEASARRSKRIIDSWENGTDRIMRGAPHLVVAHCPPDVSFPAVDCAIALTYLELYAYAKGLGTCWAGYFTGVAGMHEPIIKFLNLPAGHKCYGAVMLGYPKPVYYRIPKRNDARITWR